MKKRIITSVVITVVFALIIVTSSFIALVNVNTINDAKEILSIYNLLIADDIKNNDYDNVSLFTFKGNAVRFTVVNKDGEVIYDNEKENL